MAKSSIPKKKKSTKVEWRNCHHCGKHFDPSATGKNEVFIASSLLDPTLYFDSEVCYTTWDRELKARGETYPSDLPPNAKIRREKPPKLPI